MIPPNNVKVLDLPSFTMWLDEHGILCSVAKNVPPQTVEEAKNTMQELRKLTGGVKVCLLSDSSDSSPSNKEMRDYAAEVLPEIVKAVAIISRSAVGIMAANLFFSIKKQPYPVKMFNEESEAKDWLMQYL